MTYVLGVTILREPNLDANRTFGNGPEGIKSACGNRLRDRPLSKQHLRPKFTLAPPPATNSDTVHSFGWSLRSTAAGPGPLVRASAGAWRGWAGRKWRAKRA